MDWDTFVRAATTTSWVTYLGTITADGSPHVSVVAPGFTEGSLWFATRQDSKKFLNLTANPAASFHWPVGNVEAPGELIANGSARLFTTAEDRVRLWESGILPYDMSGFFGSPDNPKLGFGEVEIASARLLGPDFRAKRWSRSDWMG